MAEETATVEQPKTIAQNPLQALAGLEGLMSKETLAGLNEIANKNQPQTNQPAAKTEEKKEEKVDAPAQPAANQPAANEKPVEEQKEEKKNVFGVKVGKKGDDKQQAAAIENEEQLSAYLKQSFGQDIKGIKDLPKFLDNTVSKWRADAQKLSEVDKERKELIEVFEKIDPVLFDAVKASYAGDDWKKVFEAQPKLDFSKPADKHSEQALVENYFPGKFKAEDFEADEKSEALKIALEASTKSYNFDKATREQRAQAEVKKAQDYQQALKASVQSSVAHLKSSFPDADEAAITSIAKDLESGGVRSTFYNQDGTIKQEAAEMLMWARHGKELMTQLMTIAEHQGETKANEQLLDRSTEKRDAKKSGGGDNETGKKVQEFMQKQFGGMAQKNTF